MLGLPTFGMALAVTTVSTYLPVLARERAASTTAIGGILAVEGLMALWLPIVAGGWSDRIGRRLPFLIVGTPVMLLALVLFGALRPIPLLAALVVLFFVGYFVAYEPYRALYPDLVEDADAARSQSAQAGWRGGGTGLALISGGVLLSLGAALPFLVSALVLGLAIFVFVVFLRRSGRRPIGTDETADERRGHVRESFATVFQLLRDDRRLRLYLIANSLWEAALAALKTFIVLFVTAGLGYSLDEASALIGGVAIIVLGAALGTGKLADRFGRLPVMEAGVWVFGIGLLIFGVTTDRLPLIIATPLIALGGGMLMSLPYALLMPLMPKGKHGLATGLYSVSRGLGVMAGPLFAGIAIDATGGLFASTDGYAATWWIAGGAMLLSIIPLRRLRAAM